MRRACVALGWLLAGVIVWLSLIPAPPKIDVAQADKIEHLLAYGSLMFWFCQLYPRAAVRLAYAVLWIAMGVAIEYLQRWMGYRTFDVADMLANAIGVLIGWMLSTFSPRFLPK
jgi:VanZ family protein